MDYRPDLEVLESVETNTSKLYLANKAFSNSVYGRLTVAVIFAEQLLSMRHNMHFMIKANYFIAIGLLAIIFIDLCFIRVYKWRTDSGGLTARKALTSNFISWSEIHEVRPKHSFESEMPIGYDLIAHHSHMWLPAPTTMHREHMLLIGSIWQHLRRIGRGDVIQLPEKMEDLWWQIPDDIPAEVEWESSYLSGWKPLRTLLILMGLIIIVYMTFFAASVSGPHALLVIYSIGILASGLWIMMWYLLNKGRTLAETAHVGDDGIEAISGTGRKYLRWQDITVANWTETDIALQLAGRGVYMRIPNQDDADILLLSILRRLRSMDKFRGIAIPEKIRQMRSRE